MPSWNDLLSEFAAQADDPARALWLQDRLTAALQDVAGLRADRNVIFYASAFLQKPQLPGWATGINSEDINALMSVVYGMDCAKGLTLLLHTPGGSPHAAETIVAYLRSKFDYVEVIVPTFAMSAGTMISLSSNKIVMGRQSQLGPIDPQLGVGGTSFSAQGIVDQFDAAKKDIKKDTTLAHLWAPILASLGPSLLVESSNALAYGERMVATWLEFYMLAGQPRARSTAKKIARHFNNASVHKSHGRRIDRDEARSVGVSVEDLEADQALQEAVLTAYHLVTIGFDHSLTAKQLHTSAGRSFVKSVTA